MAHVVYPSIPSASRTCPILRFRRPKPLALVVMRDDSLRALVCDLLRAEELAVADARVVDRLPLDHARPPGLAVVASGANPAPATAAARLLRAVHGLTLPLLLLTSSSSLRSSVDRSATLPIPFEVNGFVAGLWRAVVAAGAA